MAQQQPFHPLSTVKSFHPHTLHRTPRKPRTSFDHPDRFDLKVSADGKTVFADLGDPRNAHGLSLMFVHQSVKDYLDLAHDLLLRARIKIPPCFTYVKDSHFQNSEFLVTDVNLYGYHNTAHVLIVPKINLTLGAATAVAQCKAPEGCWSPCVFKAAGERSEKNIEAPGDNILRIAYILLSHFLVDDNLSAVEAMFYRILLSCDEPSFVPLCPPQSTEQLLQSYQILNFPPLHCLLLEALALEDASDEPLAADLPGAWSLRQIISPFESPSVKRILAAAPRPIILYQPQGQNRRLMKGQDFAYSQPPQYNIDLLLRNADFPIGQQFLRAAKESRSCGLEMLKKLPALSTSSIIRHLNWFQGSLGVKIFPVRETDDLLLLLRTDAGANVFTAYVECISEELGNGHLLSKPVASSPLLLCERAEYLDKEVLVSAFGVAPSFKSSFVSFFSTSSLPEMKGNELARSFYNALRLYQTHVLRTNHQFFFLFTSPESKNALDFTSIHLTNGHVGIKQFFPQLTGKSWISPRFSIGDREIRSISGCFFMFVTWNSEFNELALRKLRDFFTRSHVGASSAYSTTIRVSRSHFP